MDARCVARDWCRRSKIRKTRMIDKAMSMWETCAVDLHVSLPKGVADEVADVQRRDPDMLSRIVLYAVTRRTIFDHLATRTAWPLERQET